jgi:ABC-type branched-subunit amino acid transport system substrate-binding protein
MWDKSRWVRRVAQGLVLAAAAGLTGVAVAGPTLTIGAIVPQSWPSATDGEEIVLGMQLAIKTWPGQPAPTLVVKNSACDPAKAEAAARELVAAKVDLVLGSWCAIGIAPRVVSEAGLPFVSANSERLPKAPEGVLQLGRI